jgi:hypothetical protein
MKTSQKACSEVISCCSVFTYAVSAHCTNITNIFRKVLYLKDEIVASCEAGEHDQQRMVLLELSHLAAVAARVVEAAKN